MRKLADHLGVTLRAVQLAVKRGRITPAEIKQTGKTHRVYFDVEKSEADWENNRDPDDKRRRTRREKGKGPQPRHKKPSDREGDTGPEDNIELPGDPAAPAQKDKDGKESKEAGLYSKSRAAREAYRARMIKMEFEEKSGKLADVEKLRQVWFDIGSGIQKKLLGVAGRVAPMLANETDAKKIHRIIKDEITLALTQLSGGKLYT